MKKVTLNMQENKRLIVLQEVQRREKTVFEAAQELEVSERQTYRLLSGLKRRGAEGVVHGNRGRGSKRRISEKIRRRVVELRRETYEGFNDRHFQEKLELEGIRMGRETVRKVLRGAGIEATVKKKRPKHRRRRERKERRGEMIQGDSSDHDWLEGRGPRLDLVHWVDDATGTEWADFFLQETTEGYFRTFRQILEEHGIPRSIYIDKHSVFRVNRDQTKEEQLENRRPLTTFGRAMEELGVRVIYAESAPAKGRVERRGGVHQDRLVSELRKAKVKTLEEARVVLKGHLKEFNRKFARKPKDPISAFLPIPEGFDLDQILCWKEERMVANDNTFSFQGGIYQLPRSPLRASWAKCRVAVHYCLDGSLRVFYKNERIAYFKNRNQKIQWEHLPIDPKITKNVMTQKSNLTFSRGH